MDPEFPSSPFFLRLFAEHPWTVAAPLLVLGAALAWYGSRTERARLILAGIGALLAAAAVLVGASLWRSPGEHAADAVRQLVAYAEAGDVPGVTSCFAPDASIHYGSTTAPGQDIGEILRAAESLNGRHRIQSNTITELDFATVNSSTAQVILGCRTTTNSSYGAVPTRWWMELTRTSSGMWVIQRLAFLRVANQAGSRSYF